MKKISTLIYFLMSSALAFSQSYNKPESVEYDDANNRWLVACTSGNNIQQRDANGVISLFVNVTSPYGLQIVGDTIYVCSSGRIKGFSLTGANPGTNIQITGASFLNGLAADASGNLYATDFSGNKIYRINIAGQYFTTFASVVSSSSPNGIIHDPSSNRLVFVNWGANAPIKAVSLVDSSVTTVATTSLSSCDGIARDGAGNFYVSAWGTNSIYKYDNTFSSAGVAVVTTGLTSPADIYYAVSLDTLAIPNSTTTGANANTVRFIGFGTPAPTIVSVVPVIPPDSVICWESPVYDVNFTVTGLFNSGNKFFVLGSDSLGSFANPFVMDSLLGTTSGTMSIYATQLPLGNHYRFKVTATDPVYTSADNGYDIRVDICGGISENSKSDFNIFPNPTQGKFIIDNEQLMLENFEVFNVVGEKVFTQFEINNPQPAINISDYPSGIYFLKIKMKDEIITKKIVKE